jgi:hypothetical protein
MVASRTGAALAQQGACGGTGSPLPHAGSAAVQPHAPANVARPREQHAPVIVPRTTVPFLSSISTVSLDSFIRNLRAAGRADAGGRA